MVKLNKQSKRQSTKTRAAIDRRVKEHNRKMRKAAKQSGALRKGRKDPGIPANWPFKQELLQQIQRQKEDLAREKAEQRQQAKDARAAERLAIKEGRAFAKDSRASTYEAMQAAAASKQAVYATTVDKEEDLGSIDTTGQVTDSSRRAFLRELRKVVELSDVVIQVLDARDPNSCRCAELENAIAAAGKKVILLINKIDLVPKECVKAWQKYLKNKFPAVAFKSAVGSSKAHHVKATATEASDALLQSSSAVLGAENLMQLLKNYARTKAGDKKASVTVGIVGYPNVGKSSVINSLKRSCNAVKVGGEAGVTRKMQEVQLDKHIKLIDSPGVVFSGQDNDPSTVLRNAVKLSLVKDPQAVVEALLQRCPKEALMRFFQLPAFEGAVDFLSLLARSRGRLTKGGKPDFAAAARMALTEWTTGRLKYYTLPPQEAVDVHASAAIVTAMAKEFRIDEILDAQAKALDADAEMTSADAANDMVLRPGGFGSLFHGTPAGDDVSVDHDMGAEMQGSGRRTGAASTKLPASQLVIPEQAAGGVMKLQESAEDYDGGEMKQRRRKAVLTGGDPLSKLKIKVDPSISKAKLAKQDRKNKSRALRRGEQGEDTWVDMETDDHAMHDDDQAPQLVDADTWAGEAVKPAAGKKGGKVATGRFSALETDDYDFQQDFEM